MNNEEKEEIRNAYKDDIEALSRIRLPVNIFNAVKAHLNRQAEDRLKLGAILMMNKINELK